jgi:hypothetical protein
MLPGTTVLLKGGVGPETTLRNLRLIREARERRGGIAPWMLSVEQELTRISHGA